MVWVCGNCRSEHCFTHDSHSDTFVCSSCGMSYDSMAPPVDNGKLPDGVDPFAPVRFKGSYRRRAHITERIKSAICNDPRTPPDVMALIASEWEFRKDRNLFAKARADQKIVDKNDIRTVLRSLDEKYPDLTKVPYFERILQKNPKSTLNFSTVFLERWKAIASELTGQEPRLYTQYQGIKVGTLLLRFSGIWDLWQPPSRKRDGTYKDVWKFSERKHIPNLNFLFQRVHELLGPEYTKFNSEFPVPTNPQAKKKLWKYWKHLAKEADVPLRGEDRGQGFAEPEWKQLTLSFPTLTTTTNV